MSRRASSRPVRFRPPRARRERVTRSLKLLTAAGAAILAALVALRLAPVVARGPLLEFLPPSYTVDRVRLAGLELYVDKTLGTPDVLTAGVLAAVAVFCAHVARSLRRRGDAGADTFAAAALGITFLAGDDLLALHETVGHNLGFLAGVVGVDHPDDLIIGAYAIVVGAFCWRHRRLAPRRSRPIWAGAAVAGAAAVILDLLPFDLTRAEESLELLCALGVLLATIVTARAQLRA